MFVEYFTSYVTMNDRRCNVKVPKILYLKKIEISRTSTRHAILPANTSKCQYLELTKPSLLESTHELIKINRKKLTRYYIDRRKSAIKGQEKEVNILKYRSPFSGRLLRFLIFEFSLVHKFYFLNRSMHCHSF